MICDHRHIRTLKAQNEEDEEELQTLQADRNTFLCTAIENYLKCLEAGVNILYHNVCYLMLLLHRMIMTCMCFGWCLCGLLTVVIILST